MSWAFAPTKLTRMNRVGFGSWPGRDSAWWLVAVGVAFTAAELLFVPPRMGLSWDEVVYVSQVSGHAPAAWFDPARRPVVVPAARARGAGGAGCSPKGGLGGWVPPGKSSRPPGANTGAG